MSIIKNCTTLIFCFILNFAFAQNNRLWSTYYGATSDDYAQSTVIDKHGNVYLGGYTANSSGISSKGFQNSYGGGQYDAFLVKFDSLGNRLWATYYGGSGDDYCKALAVDTSGNVYMAGRTRSPNAIAAGGFQNSYGGAAWAGFGDAFLVKFNSNGNRLWATYFGGAQDDAANGVATDASGNVYIGGFTGSGTGLAFNGFQNTGIALTFSAFLAKFDANGARLWSTYYGGGSLDIGTCVTTDPYGNVYLGGNTESSGLGFKGFQTTYFGSGVVEGFLTKFDTNGNRIWATYYGGAGGGYTIATGTTSDINGNVFLTGTTTDPTGIAAGGFQNSIVSGDATYLVKFDSLCNRQWATYYVRTFYQAEPHVASDLYGNIFLAGITTDPGHGAGGFRDSLITPGYNAFLVKFNPVGARLCATYYGDKDWLYGANLAIDKFDHIYLSGTSVGTTGIASNGFQNNAAGKEDAYIVKFNTCCVELKVAIQVTSVLCNGQCNGTATVFPSGCSTYKYAWNPNVGNGSIITGLCPGTYTVTITDITSKTITSTVVITEPPPFSVSASSNPVCGINNGNALANISGVTGPYSYSWTPAGGIDSVANNLTSGLYSIIVTDANGCTKVQSVNVVVNPPPVVAVSPTSAIINYGCSINLNVTGGTNCLWDSSLGLSCTNCLNPIASPLTTTNYCVKVTAATGCSDTACVKINVNPLSVFAKATGVSCFGQCNGASTVFPSGCSSYTYNWSPLGGINSMATGLCPGFYTVTITDASSVTASTVVEITQPSDLSLTINSTPICGVNNGLASAIASGGVNPFSFQWMPYGGTGSVASNLQTGIYSLTVTDSNNCIISQTVNVTAYLNPKASISPASTSILYGKEAHLIAGGGETYVWKPSEGLSCNTCAITEASPSISTRYCVYVTDKNGCEDSSCVYIEVVCGEVFIPKAFSPNNDGQNDVLFLRGGCIQTFDLSIFNRWGEKVFETGNQSYGWDGTFAGKSCSEDVYTYNLNATMLDGSEVSKKGNITLVR